VEGTASVKIFGREPALVGAMLQSILALVLGFGIIPGLDTETVGLVTAAGAAVFGAYVAFAVKQNLLPAIVAAFQALVAVAVGFGLDFLTPDKTALITAALTAILGFFLRTQADPKAGTPTEPTVLQVEYPEGEPDDVGDEDEDALYTEFLPSVDGPIPPVDGGTIFSGSDEDEKR
jgi:hypothetical protein